MFRVSIYPTRNPFFVCRTMIEPTNQYFQEKTYKKRIRGVVASLIAASLVILILWFGLFLFSHLTISTNISKAQERLLDTIPGNYIGFNGIMARDSLTF